MSTSQPEAKAINLALQGGGAHGAFTWGVLDRLLADERVIIEAISGTSAGAINAAVLADGFEKGGASGAREALARFWGAMSLYGAFSPYHSDPFNPLGVDWSPLAFWFDLLAQLFSPYQLNPLNINPLRTVLTHTLDFDRLRHCQSIQLYISATNVRTNRLHVFTSSELSPDVLLASATLPHLHHAVEIDGEAYWDGGFMGNPILEPLIYHCSAADIVIVQVNPTHRDRVPWTADEILDRENEITFNSSLMRELRAFSEIARLVEAGVIQIQDPRYQQTCFHLIDAAELLKDFGMRSKFNTSWYFLSRLCDLGYAQAERWLEEHFARLGHESTLDLRNWAPPYARGAHDAP